MQVSFYISHKTGHRIPRVIDHHYQSPPSSFRYLVLLILISLSILVILILLRHTNRNVMVTTFVPSIRLSQQPLCQASITVFSLGDENPTRYTMDQAIKHIPLFRSGSNLSLENNNHHISFHAHPMSPESILQCFYSQQEQQSLFKTILTFDPKPNCQGGRYLDFIRPKDHLPYLALDGMGSFLATYMNMLSVAVLTQTTIIDFEWYDGGITHSQDETLEQRQAFFNFDRFHLSRQEFYRQCPPETSLTRQNVIDITHLLDFVQTTNFLDRRSDSSKDFDFLPEFRMDLNNLIMEHTYNLTKHLPEDEHGHNSIMDREKIGYTLVFNAEIFASRNDLQYAAPVMEARYNAFHPYRTIMNGEPPGSHYLQQLPWLGSNIQSEIDISGRQPLFYQDFTTIPYTSSIFVAIHIRRNDVITIRDNNVAYIREAQTHYMITDDAFIQIICSVHHAIPDRLRQRLVYTIYSEGQMADFHYIAQTLQQKFQIAVQFRLNGATTRIMKHLIQADILIMSTSSFSYASASMHHDQLKIDADGNQKPMFTRLPNVIETDLIRHPIDSSLFTNSSTGEREIKLSDVNMTWTLKKDSAKLLVAKLVERFSY